MDMPRKNDYLDVNNKGKNIKKSHQNQPNPPKNGNNYTNSAAATMSQTNDLTDKINFQSDVQYHGTLWSKDNPSPSQNLSPPQPLLPQLQQQSMMSLGDLFKFNSEYSLVTTTMPSSNFNRPHGGVAYNSFGQPSAPNSKYLQSYRTSDPNMLTPRPLGFQNPPPPIPNFSASQRSQARSLRANADPEPYPHSDVAYNSFGQPNAPTSQHLPPHRTSDPNMFTPRPPEFQNPPPPISNFSTSQRAQAGSLRPNADPAPYPLLPRWKLPWFPSESDLFKTPSWDY